MSCYLMKIYAKLGGGPLEIPEGRGGGGGKKFPVYEFFFESQLAAGNFFPCGRCTVGWCTACKDIFWKNFPCRNFFGGIVTPPPPPEGSLMVRPLCLGFPSMYFQYKTRFQIFCCTRRSKDPGSVNVLITSWLLSNSLDTNTQSHESTDIFKIESS